MQTWLVGILISRVFRVRGVLVGLAILFILSNFFTRETAQNLFALIFLVSCFIAFFIMEGRRNNDA